MPTSKTGTSTETGFTLVELTVVLLLIGLIFSLVLPRLPGIGENRLKSTARRLSGMAQHLFNEAALTGNEHQLVFSIDDNSVTGKMIDADGELVYDEEFARQTDLGAVRLIDVDIPGRGKATRGQVTTRVLPIGWIEETVIHIKGENEQVMTLHLQPLTGTTTVYEGYRDFD